MGRDGESGFLFVEEDLDEDILVLGTTAIEDELYVGTHGEDAGAPPAALFKFVKVAGGEVVAIDADETYQWENDGLVAEAQLCSGTVEADATVSVGNELSQEVSLSIGLPTAIEFAGSVLDVPEGVVYLPHAIELFGLEETQQEGLGLHVGIEDKESHLHKVVVEECLVDDFLDDVGILEDHLHQTAVTRSRSDVGVVGLASFGGHIALA
jgi:hypothetical protein